MSASNSAHHTPVALTIPILHQRLLREVRNSNNAIKSFDPVGRQLTVLPWCVIVGPIAPSLPSSPSYRPVVEASRVTPCNLPSHRATHRFVGPCCLCPLFLPNSGGLYIEASMSYETSGIWSGQFVAKCSRNECGYFGELTILLSIRHVRF